MNYIQPAMGYVFPYWYAYEPDASAAAEPAISSTLKRRLFQGLLDLVGIVLTFVIFAIVLFAAVSQPDGPLALASLNSFFLF